MQLFHCTTMMCLTISTLLILLPSCVLSALQLSHVKTMYLPYRLPPNERFGFDKKVLEQIAYDEQDKLIYTVGSELLHVIDMQTVSNMTLVYSQKFEKEDMTDVEVCGDLVFVAVTDLPMSGRGFIRIFHKYNRERNEMKLAKSVEVGSLPDMVLPFSDCTKAVTVLEGERFKHPTTGNWIDPKGEVAILELPQNLDDDNADVLVTKLDFEEFDSKFSELKAQGVRMAYIDNNTTFSVDAEPEYVAIDEKTMTAYICLQENNAIAVVDLKAKRITALHGLGYKQWGYLDASSDDGGISVTLWPIRSWYQPDAIYTKTYHGRRLLFTANEGDTKDYDDGYDERQEGKAFKVSRLGDSIPSWVKDALQDNKKLGELQFAKNDGLVNGMYEALYTFGGRSWSIRDADNNMTLLYDSGSDVEEKTALLCPHLFNRNGDEIEIDTQSRKKGPQPEALKVVEIEGRLYIFIGIERPGTVMVYSVGDDVTKPRFEQLFCDGLPASSKTPKMLYDERLSYGIDAEDLKFVPASKSPNNSPLLLVAGSVSGTLSVLRVNVTQAELAEESEHTDASTGNMAWGTHHSDGTLLSVLIPAIMAYFL